MEASNLGGRPLAFLRVVLVVAVAESFVHYLATPCVSPTTRATPTHADVLDQSLDDPRIVGAVHRGGGRRLPAVLPGASGRGRGVSRRLLAERSDRHGHYLGVSIHDLSVFQNMFVFLDIALGVIVLVFAIWTARQARGYASSAAA